MMRKIFNYVMALAVALAVFSCSTHKDEPLPKRDEPKKEEPKKDASPKGEPEKEKPQPPRPLTAGEYVASKQTFTSQASDIKVKGGPVAGELSSEQKAKLTFTSPTDFTFQNQIDLTALKIPFKIKVSFSGTYAPSADESISLQAKGETLEVEIDAEIPSYLSLLSGTIKAGVNRAIGLTEEKLNASAIPCKVDQAGHKLTLTYPEGWNTPMTNVFVWATPTESEPKASN